MKTLLILIILIVAGIFAWQYFSQPPDPEQQRLKAQQAGHLVIDYWLKSAQQGRISDMLAVCDETAKGQAQGSLEAIQKREAETGWTFDEYNFYTMGGGGAFKAVIGSKDGGILMYLTIRAEKKGDKYWIVSVSPD